MAIPKTPESFFVIKRNNHAIVKWDKVVEDVDDNPITVKKYNVYRTRKTNSKEYVLFKEVNTTDFNSDIDTCFVDIDIEVNEVYFYKISCIDISDIEGEATSEKSGIYFGDLQDNKPEKAELIAGRWDVSTWNTVVYT